MNPEKKKNIDTSCRVCKTSEGSVYHLACACPILAPTIYLNARHNQLARVIYQEQQEVTKSR